MNSVGARAHYRPQLHDGPIAFFKAKKPWVEQDLQELWSLVTTGHVDFVSLDATHWEIWLEPWVTETAAELSKRIEEGLRRI